MPFVVVGMNRLVLLAKGISNGQIQHRHMPFSELSMFLVWSSRCLLVWNTVLEFLLLAGKINLHSWRPAQNGPSEYSQLRGRPVPRHRQ